VRIFWYSLDKLMLLRLLAAISITFSTLAQDLTPYVDPMVGTGGTGHTYPGVTMPHGMVQLSPDTRRDGSWEGCSGYYYPDSLIYGFSHTHLSGTGCSDYGDILMMPFTGAVTFEPTAYASRYRHNDEVAKPGYYAVTLTNNDIRAEFTATTRVGMHRYHYSQNAASIRGILIDLRHRDKTLGSKLKIVSPTRIEGYRHSEAWAKDQYVYFVIEFSQQIISCTSNQTQRSLTPGMEIESDSVAVALHFNKGADDILVKVAISSVDYEGAGKNLAQELPDWDFEKTRREATTAWNSELGRIRVAGKSDQQLRNFYTALYHTMVVPNVMSDVDGRYRGRDNQVHHATSHTQYSVFSLWDTFRAAHPLYTLIDSVRTIDYIKTFLLQYKQGGRLPVWELSANETDCMIGYHSIPVITDALVKGVAAFDTSLAFEAMKVSSNWDHLGIPAYKARGYLSIEDEHESVSKTLEYAYDDWCIAEVARTLGKMDEAAVYNKRALSYRNIFDRESGFMRPRRNGDFLRRFDPREVNNHYTEANSWQYTFFVPQDIPGFISLMGGPVRAEQQLDALFSAPIETTGRTQADITGLIGQYAHGNEPSHHMAYLYNYIGKPWKTQRLVRQIMDSLYKPTPDGLPGNEDCGQMSAWYVFSALGFYPVTPGSPYYAVGTPLFDTARISIGMHDVKIIAQRETSASIYVNKLIIDGIPLNTNLVTHTQLKLANEIRFILSDTPNDQRGTDIEYRGAMMSVDFVSAPFIISANKLFTDSAEVSISGDSVTYTLDSDSSQLGNLYTKPFLINKTTRIHARSHRNGHSSGVTSATFYRIPTNWHVTLHSTPNPQYVAEGAVSMIDGIRGSTTWRKGDWHGIQGEDMDVEIRLDTTRTVKNVSVGFLQDVRPWIVFPKSVSIQTSLDGIVWVDAGTTTHAIPVTDMEPQLATLTIEIPSRFARFVRVRAESFGKLPLWHPGAGHDAFIFCDEIQIQ